MRFIRLRSLILITGAAALAACGSSSDSDGVTPPPTILPVLKVDGRYHSMPRQAEVSTLKRQDASAHALPASTIVLPPLNSDTERLKNLSDAGLLQVGTRQAVTKTLTVEQFAAQLHWQPQADGSQRAALELQAPDAYGIRLGLLVEALPDQADVLVLQPGDNGMGVLTSGSQINALLAANASAGDTGNAGKTWWSPDLGGDSVRLEITLPPGLPSASVRLALPSISNIFIAPHEFEPFDAALDLAPETREKAEFIPAAEPCMLDVSCYTNGQQQRDAVARMRFVRDGNAYMCTGTLLNDAIASGLPYFLTAGHCINTQAAASTLQTDWFFRSASCNSPFADVRHTSRTGGARLLATSNIEQGNDASLLLLNDAAPPGTYFAGWDAGPNDFAQPVYSIHHPAGTLARISAGQTLSYTSNMHYYVVQWQNGSTQGGSSGGALFSGSGHVLGMLSSGSASCTHQSAPDFYGRFDQAFAYGMREFLAASRPPF